MKSIFASLALLFIFVASLAAQPQNYHGFYPYQTCSFSPTDKVIFSGSLVSTESVKDPSLLNRLAFYKAKIKVEKVFKGNIKKTVEVLWGEDGLFFDLKEGDERIFIVNEVNLNNFRFLLSRKWSQRLNDRPKNEKDNIFSLINSRIKRYPKSPPLVGVVIEKKSSAESSPNKVFTTFGYEYTGFNLKEGIIIEAKRKSDGKTFQVKTNKEGYYVFDKLSEGDYHVYPLFPQQYERISQAYLDYVYNVQTDSCNELTVFKMKK